MTVAVLLGAPGAGKGTQAPLPRGAARRARARVRRPAASRGRERQRDRARGRRDHALRRARARRPDGPPVPGPARSSRTPRGGAILDGFPRTRRQAEALDAALAASGRPVDRALLIEVPIEDLIGRFAGPPDLQGRRPRLQRVVQAAPGAGACATSTAPSSSTGPTTPRRPSAPGWSSSSAPLHDVADYYRGAGHPDAGRRASSRSRTSPRRCSRRSAGDRRAEPTVITRKSGPRDRADAPGRADRRRGARARSSRSSSRASRPATSTASPSATSAPPARSRRSRATSAAAATARARRPSRPALHLDRQRGRPRHPRRAHDPRRLARVGRRRRDPRRLARRRRPDVRRRRRPGRGPRRSWTRPGWR